MTFLPITPYDSLDDAAKAAAERQIQSHGGTRTPMQSALLGHVPSFAAFMEWYTIKDELVPYIGERAATLFAYAISDENDCRNCAAYFRKQLVDSGENVDDPQVTEAEQLLMDWGRLIARAPHDIPDEMYNRLESSFNPKLRLILVAFAALTVASNLVNTVGRIPLDDQLSEYDKK